MSKNINNDVTEDRFISAAVILHVTHNSLFQIIFKLLTINQKYPPNPIILDGYYVDH